VAKVAQAGLAIFAWLHLFSLKADLDKPEVMFFHPPCPLIHLRTRPPLITLTDGINPPIHVILANSLCYLGVVFTPHLSWTLHVTTMAMRVHSMVHTLGVLGNSV
jgi:hypothetical protein